MKLEATCKWFYKLVETITIIIDSQSFQKKLGYPANLPLEISSVHKVLEFKVTGLEFLSQTLGYDQEGR